MHNTKITTHIHYLLLGILSFAFFMFYMNSCSNYATHRSSIKPDTLVVRDTLYVTKTDTVSNTKVVLVNRIKTKTDTSYKTKIDTVYALEAYLAKNVYRDTIDLPDESGNVTITDTVYKNELLTRSYIAKVNQKTIVETVKITLPPKSGLYLGPTIGVQAGNPTIGVDVSFYNKGVDYYRIGTGVDHKSNPYFNATYGVRIFGK